MTMTTTMELQRQGARTVDHGEIDDTRIHRGLVEFFAREFPRTEGRMCVRIGLYKAAPGQKGTELRAWTREEQPDLFAKMAEMETLATMMLEIARNEADTAGTGSHRFEVRTVQYLQGMARHSFKVQVDPEDLSVGGIETPPSSEGLVAQAIRHTEWAVQMALQSANLLTGAAQQQIRQLNAQNQELYEDRRRMHTELETARADQDAQTMATILAERADDRKQMVLDQLLPLAPIALSRLMSKDSAPGSSAGALGPVLIRLFDSLQPEQAQKMVSLFSPQQKMLFAEMYTIVNDLKAAQANTGVKKDDGTGSTSGSAAGAEGAGASAGAAPGGPAPGGTGRTAPPASP